MVQIEMILYDRISGNDLLMLRLTHFEQTFYFFFFPRIFFIGIKQLRNR
uniref:Chloroplast envelope protein n=1 Tax=Pinus morrisonicola TaxID=139307 RepID=A0A346PZZ6_9CONI|nr:chloroplast envelope protein [Pinus morrisonicola]AXR86322.1 chloroplast envelope protein [Pinus morrisonicola]